MSAYIVDDTVYSNLYHYLLAEKYFDCKTFPQENREDRILHFITNLRQANYHSVNVRYRESTVAPAWKPAKTPSERYSDVQAFKSLQSIDYQSCEFEEWPETRAWAGLQEAQAHIAYNIIINLPIYQSAIWT